MTKRKRLKLKRQSLKKWRGIVADLDGSKPLKEKPRFTVDDCGYCTIYFGLKTDCNGCPLYKMPLCTRGSGEAFISNVRFYYEQSLQPRPTRRQALAGAKRILKAVERDIANETK